TVKAIASARTSDSQPRGACAHDYQITLVRLIHRRVKTETVGNLLVRGIAQHCFAATDHHRYVGDGNMKMFKQVLYVSITFNVDIRVGVTVAGKELLDAKCVGGVVGAHQR